METVNENELGRVAFEIYAGEVQQKDYKGFPLPTWDKLASDQIRQAWQTSAYSLYCLGLSQRDKEMEISHKVKEHYEELLRITQWFKDNRLSREFSIVHNDLDHLVAYYNTYLMPIYNGTEIDTD